MTEPLLVTFTVLARQHIRQAEQWWRENRTLAPSAVRQELEHALVLISRHPDIGSRVANVKMPGVRRIYLPTIKQHLYYHVLKSPDRLEVLALWHTRRGKGPSI